MGFFGDIGRGLSRAAKSVASEAVDVVQVAATPVTAVARAAVDVAKGERVDKAVGRAVTRQVDAIEAQANRLGRLAKPLRSVPVLGTAVGQAVDVQKLVFDAGKGNVARTLRDVAQGTRVDKALGRAGKRQVAAYDAMVPYVQTALSFVPGPGQGLSAAIGAAHALAHGKPISEALLAAVQSALPGGPIAQAAFGAAVAAAQGKPLDLIAINALPLSSGQKKAIEQAATVAKQVATGQRVDKVLYDNAVQYLQANVGEAIQAGMTMGQAKALQTAKSALPQTPLNQIQQAATQVQNVRSQVNSVVSSLGQLPAHVLHGAPVPGLPWNPIGWLDHLPKGHS